MGETHLYFFHTELHRPTKITRPPPLFGRTPNFLNLPILEVLGDQLVDCGGQFDGIFRGIWSPTSSRRVPKPAPLALTTPMLEDTMGVAMPKHDILGKADWGKSPLQRLFD